MKKPETLSLLGKPLYADDQVAGADVDALESNIAEARARFEENPDDVQQLFAYADAAVARGRFQEAVGLYTAALQKWPDEPMLLARRGHRYINTRQFHRALQDLERAAEIEDNSFYIWYHLGISHWMLRNFDAAAETFRRCLPVVPHESQLAAATDWVYMALHRLGRKAEAATLLKDIHPDMEMTGNNQNYLHRLLFYRGELTEDELVATCRPGTLDLATVAFGLGNWHLSEGNEEAAKSYYRQAADHNHWAAFGVLGAEAELAHMTGTVPEEPETYSLLGQPLYGSLLAAPEAKPALEQALAEAQAEVEAHPEDVERVRALAKSLAGLGRYAEAQKVLTDALETRFPGHALLLCDRGHYNVNLRKYDEALVDLHRAARDADSEFAVWYHMALAYWMSGRFEQALETFQKCYDVTTDESHKVAVTEWLYVALRRLGRHDEAATLLEPVHADMKTRGNNHLYLKQLMFYRGEMTEAELMAAAEQGGLAVGNYYTLGLWHLIHGRADKARALFEKVVREGTAWSAFAHMGAEAELCRTSVGEPQTMSLLGRPLYAATARAKADADRLEQALEEARREMEAHPGDVWRYILYVKRWEAAHDYRKAIRLYTEALERWPEHPMLYCHRGHRRLNLREFDGALADLNKAGELLPDNFDVLYHSGLVHYMQGRYEEALAAFTRCADVTTDEGNVPPTSALKLIAPAPVLLIGTVHWLYMTYSRLERFDEAEQVLERIPPELDAGGNLIAYLNLVRFYQGAMAEEEVVAQFGHNELHTQTMGYGLGNWHYCRGNYAKARQYFEKVAGGTQWSAFGRIAAEVDLSRNLPSPS